MIPEFIGRLPVIAHARTSSTRTALVEILTKPKNALVKQYQKLFEMDGVKLKFTRRRAQGGRARGARSARRAPAASAPSSRSAMLDIMYDVPSRRNVREVVITEDVIDKKEAPLIVMQKEAESA